MSGEHTDVGAYSLGLLEQQDRQAFEAHLAGCPACAAELAELAGMSELLSGVGPVETADEQPDETAVADLVHRRAAAQRRRVRWQAALAAAAGIVLLAGGIAAGIAAGSHQSTPAVTGVALQGHLHTATDSATGVHGTVGLVAKPWGTQVTFDLSRIRGPLECQLVAVSKTGQQRVIVGWLVPAHGYGVPGHPAHLLLEGGTSIKQNDLLRINVDVVRGRTLLSIPI
jgi:Putative zinc-finger